MKRAFSLILVLILLLGMAVPATAAGTPTLSISSGEVKAGETIELVISMKDNPGILGVKMFLYYDTDSLTLDAKRIKSLGDFSSIGACISNDISTAKENGRYDGAMDKDGAILLWYSSNGSDVSVNGDMLKICFRVNKTAADGDHTIVLDTSLLDTANQAGEHVSITGDTATVKVTGGDSNKQPEKVESNKVEFTDISGHWAETYIDQASAAGLVEGYLGQYRPDDTMTRAEFVTILWRAMGEPKPNRKASFTDLVQDWYKDAVAWAEQNQVVNGMGDGKFEPNGQVTREQLVTILHRLAGTPAGMELMFTSVYDQQYQDSKQIGDWAKNALYWAVYNEIYCGVNAVEIGSSLYPKSPANRAQIAVMMTRYLSKND